MHQMHKGDVGVCLVRTMYTPFGSPEEIECQQAQCRNNQSAFTTASGPLIRSVQCRASNAGVQEICFTDAVEK